MLYTPAWNRLSWIERLSLLGLLLVAGGTVAFFSFFATVPLLILAIRTFGVAALLVVIGFCCWGAYGVLAQWRQRQSTMMNWRTLRQYSVPVGTWLICSLVAISAYPMANRIQMDEVVVLGTSKAIHEEREPVVPTLLRMVNGIGKLDNGYVDKRPFLFATMVAFCHDLRGYSPKNPFFCNMVFGGLALGLAGLLGARLGRSQLAGALAMIALTAVPLFCEHVTGGGIDILNLTMILAVAYLAMWHVESPTVASARALVGAGILLAYARYESLLYLALPCFALIVVFRRHKQLFIDWTTPVMALCLFPLAAIHFLTFSRSDQFFQLADKGVDNAFSFSYIFPNLGHAVFFFLDIEHFLPNSPAVFLLGTVAIVAMGVAGARRRREIAACAVESVFWVLAALVGTAFLLLMAYSWGELDQFVASRLSLPLYLLLALSLSYCCRELTLYPRLTVLLAIAVAISGYWSVFPLAGKQYGRRLYATGQVLERFDEFAQQQPDRHFMVLNGSTNFWLTRDIYAVPPQAFKSNPAYLRELLTSGLYRRIYHIQVFERESPEAEFTVAKFDNAGTPMDTTLVFDDLVTDIRRVRVSLVNLGTVALLDRAIAEQEAKAKEKVAAAPQPTVPAATAERSTK